MGVGVSTCANILSSTLSSTVKDKLSAEELNIILGSAEAVTRVTPYLQETIRQAFSLAFTTQMQAVWGITAAGLLCTLIMVEKKPRFQATATVN